MCFGGGGQTPAGDYLMTVLPGLYQSAQALAKKPVTPYTGQLAPNVAPQIGAATQIASNLGNYQPQQVGPTMASAPRVSAVNSGVYGLQMGAPVPSAFASPAVPRPDVSGLGGQARRAALQAWRASNGNVGGSDMAAAFGPAIGGPAVSAMQGLQGQDAYMNPYIGQVADRTLADLDRFRQMSLNDNASQANMAGAWGNNRLGVENALTNEGFANQAASALANLYSGGFNTSAGLLMGDKDRLLQNSQFNAGLQQQSNLANQQSLLTTNLANQQIGLQGQLANQGAGLEAARLGLGAAGQLGQLGALQFGQEQASTNAAYQEFLRQINDPLMKQQLLNQTAAGFGGAMSGQYVPMQNLFGSSGGSAIGGIASAIGTYAASDATLKTDVRTVGFDAKGRRWVDFRYVWDDPDAVRRGIIAQEIAESDPDAVSRDPVSGFLMVDYAKLST